MKILLAVILMLLPIGAFAQSTTRYFGYYYDDADNSFQQNYNQINLFHIAEMSIAGGTADRDATTQYTLGQLAQAKALGVRAIISATPYVFYWNATSQTWSTEPNAVTAWSTFVNALVASGYIVPGRPDLSTVAAIYLIDEPDGQGFGDVNGEANPALVNAASAVRNNPSTSNIPLASILTSNFPNNFSQGIKQLNWVGFDAYGSTQSQWSTLYSQLVSMMSATQRTIIVPKAALGASLGSGSYDDPNFFDNIFNTDSKVVWFAPFVWFSTSTITGTGNIPALRTAYTQIGASIKASGCAYSLSARSFCAGAAKKTSEVMTQLLMQ